MGVLAGGGLECVFQPIVALESGVPVGFEALARSTPSRCAARAPGSRRRRPSETAWSSKSPRSKTAIMSFAAFPVHAFVAIERSPRRSCPLALTDGYRQCRSSGGRGGRRARPIADYPMLRAALAALRAAGARRPWTTSVSDTRVLRPSPVGADIIELDEEVHARHRKRAQRSPRVRPRDVRPRGRGDRHRGWDRNEVELAVVRDLGIPGVRGTSGVVPRRSRSRR